LNKDEKLNNIKQQLGEVHLNIHMAKLSWTINRRV